MWVGASKYATLRPPQLTFPTAHLIGNSGHTTLRLPLDSSLLASRLRHFPNLTSFQPKLDSNEQSRQSPEEKQAA